MDSCCDVISDFASSLGACPGDVWSLHSFCEFVLFLMHHCFVHRCHIASGEFRVTSHFLLLIVTHATMLNFH